jgi:hypothetical protein
MNRHYNLVKYSIILSFYHSIIFTNPVVLKHGNDFTKLTVAGTVSACTDFPIKLLCPYRDERKAPLTATKVREYFGL